MKMYIRLFFAVMGVGVIIFQIIHIGDSYRGMDSPLWGILFGLGLIIAPFTALMVVIGYLLMVGVPISLGFFGLFMAKDFSDDSLWMGVGFFIGLGVGVKIVGSSAFGKLMDELGKLQDKDEV